MNKSFIATTLILATLPVTAVAAETDTSSQLGEHSAIMEATREMGEHPAVLVARTWSKRGYDQASKIASHPALSKAAAEGVPNVAAGQEPQSRLER